jgi:hypothetical protein
LTPADHIAGQAQSASGILLIGVGFRRGEVDRLEASPGSRDLFPFNHFGDGVAKNAFTVNQ